MNWLRPILEFAVLMPGTLLAYLPMKEHLRMRPKKVFTLMVLLLLGLSVGGGAVCYALQLSTSRLMPFFIIVTIAIYVHTLNVSSWKSVNIALAICAAFACVSSISRAINAMLTSENEPWFCLGAALVYNAICWFFVLVAWYPATHAAKELVEDEIVANTWYVFWILPAVFIALNLFMVPTHEGTLYHGRIMEGYIVISIVLLAILGLFYGMFYMMAKSLNINARLQQENQFLSMQQAQYDNLCIAIEETRHARHDLRHHFNALSTLLKHRDWTELESYLTKAQSSIPNMELKFCDNRAVDGVLGHYCTLARRDNIPFFVQIDLPQTLPVDDMDMCLVLSNLLENALEASLRMQTAKQHIKIEIYLHSEHVVLLSVENAFDGAIKEKRGILQSSKRRGDGVGIQSVRRIAEKNGGYSRFSYENGIFTANVMLRGN